MVDHVLKSDHASMKWRETAPDAIRGVYSAGSGSRASLTRKGQSGSTQAAFSGVTSVWAAPFQSRHQSCRLVVDGLHGALCAPEALFPVICQGLCAIMRKSDTGGINHDIDTKPLPNVSRGGRNVREVKIRQHRLFQGWDLV